MVVVLQDLNSKACVCLRIIIITQHFWALPGKNNVGHSDP